MNALKLFNRLGQDNIPSDSLIRKVHFKKCYTEVLDYIQNEIRYIKVWVSIDETTDVCSRSVAHFIIGILSKDKNECTLPVKSFRTPLNFKINELYCDILFQIIMKLLYDLL